MMFDPGRFLCSIASAGMLLVCGGSASAADNADGKRFTQQPAVAPSQVRTMAAADGQAVSAEQRTLQEGPAPTWIWGADDNRRYTLRKEFEGGSKAAWLQATSDNHMTLFLNGRQVAKSSTWQEPVVLDVQKHLKPGKNELRVEVANEGGPAGFVLKLALTDADGKTRQVVSDRSWQAAEEKQENWVAVRTLGKMGVGPWNDVFARPAGLVQSPRDVFNLLPGFQVELLYTVPRDQQGSWVALAVDNKGRLIASDQGDKGLCRITPPPVGSDQPTLVEHLDVKITGAQGILYAFDALYLSVNGGPGSGLYRARDTNGDDQFDEVVKLKDFRGGGEHGPHALRLSPDGKSIYVMAGNHTEPPANFDHSRVPSNWGEDLLLPRQWDANGHARGRLAPGGWAAKTDPEGKTWEIVSIGYRNAYSMDFNADGELFAYDADMEWDMGTPWYRPTRVSHATGGSEFGWRSGTGKWPTYYIDNLPELIDIGPGSPVGMMFGYGTKFPAKHQKALYILDWTFGTIYALHLEPHGASYKAEKEEFLSRTPLPLTDIVMGADGALYFAIGGRGAQSELYRVTYTGDEPTAPVEVRDSRHADLRALRHKFEELHVAASPRDARETSAIDFPWPHLSHEDRHIRYAARVALEHQPVEIWQERLLAEKDAETLINGAVALARQGDASLQPKLLAALDRIDFGKLSERQQLDLLRVWSLVFIRMGQPDQQTAARLAQKLDAFYPAESDPLNRELSTVLVYLQSPTVITKTLALMEQPSQQTAEEIDELLARNMGYGNAIARMLANQPDIEKVHFAFVLRNLRYGWTLEQRQAYFNALNELGQRSGGNSYQGFLKNIRTEALENASDAERKAIESSVPVVVKATELPKPQGPGRDWTLDELVALAENGLTADRSFENGRKTYAAARCIVCHRFDGEGGATGPDLTNLAGRFSLRHLSEKIIDPNRNISDQYRASIVLTTEGQVHTGRIVSQTDQVLVIVTDPEDATKIVEVPRSKVEEVTPSPTSLMPKDLLKSLNRDEVLDLFAYLISRGNPQDALFSQNE